MNDSLYNVRNWYLPIDKKNCIETHSSIYTNHNTSNYGNIGI